MKHLAPHLVQIGPSVEASCLAPFPPIWRPSCGPQPVKILGFYLCCSAWYNSLDPSHPARQTGAESTPQPLGQQEHLPATQTRGHSWCSQLKVTEMAEDCRVWWLDRGRERVRTGRKEQMRNKAWVLGVSCLSWKGKPFGRGSIASWAQPKWVNQKDSRFLSYLVLKL